MSFINRLKPLVKKSPNLGNNLELIHIGKCGGSTVSKELQENNIQFSTTHITKAQYSPNKEYIIVIRNPISRYVSAYNWRYKLVVLDQVQKNRFPGEKELLEKYKSANELAENIYNEHGDLIIDFQNDENYIHHLTEDIHYYIGDFLTEVKGDQIKAVISTETLNRDMKNLLGVNVTKHEKYNKKETYLSQTALNNLKSYFKKDFQCIDKLYAMKLIDKKKHNLLSLTNFPPE